MKLLTKEIEKKFGKYPFLSQDGKGLQAQVIVKYFNPYGRGTWLITEAEKRDDGDWLLYGYVELFGDWEWGEVLLSEIENTKVNVMGCMLPLERDMYSKLGTVEEMIA